MFFYYIVSQSIAFILLIYRDKQDWDLNRSNMRSLNTDIKGKKTRAGDQRVNLKLESVKKPSVYCREDFTARHE